MVEKIQISKLSDEEVLKLIYSEYKRISPKNHKEFYQKSSLPSLPALQKRFGMKYNDILLLANVPLDNIKIAKPNEYYLDRLKNLSIKLGHSPSINELKKEGFDQTIYFQRFGSYNNALIAAGLQTSKSNFVKRNIGKKQIISDYKELSKMLGKPASQKDFNNYMNYSAHLAIIRFGGFNKLREAAGYPIDNRGANNKIYCREVVLNMLVKDFVLKGKPLTSKELSEREEYPNISTMTHLFGTTKMTEIWNEVSIKAIEQLSKPRSINGDDNRIRAGKIGETNIAHNLKFLKPTEYIVYNDIEILTDMFDVPQNIDHLVIGPNGVFGIETKHLKGEIIVKSGSKWEKYVDGNYGDVENPTQQVMRHENVLKSLLGDDMPIVSIIAMGNYNTKVKSRNLCPYPIVDANNILPHIQEYKSNRVLSQKDIKSIDKILRKHIMFRKSVNAG